jgi:hypothetical protein
MSDKPPVDLKFIKDRCRLSGDCWEWSLCAKDQRYPKMWLRLPQEDGAIKEVGLYVRHVVRWISQGSRFDTSGGRVIRMICSNPMCVNPGHMRATTRSEVNKESAGFQSSMAIRKKFADGRRKGSKLSDSDVADIRASEMTPRELAAKYEISLSYTYMLLKNEWRKDYSNPFLQLAA